jgi:hypothetical protein
MIFLDFAKFYVAKVRIFGDKNYNTFGAKFPEMNTVLWKTQV